MKTTSRFNILLPAIVFLLALLVRIFLFVNVYPNERHCFAGFYGSAAIGLFNGSGLTYNSDETAKIEKTKNIETARNFNDFRNTGERKKWLYGLPGPAVTIAILWKLTNIKNYLPYIILQVLLDSLLIALFSVACKKYFSGSVFYVLLFFLVFNPIAISKTLSVSYDFWAPFSVMVGFTGLLFAFSRAKNNHVLFFTGVVTGITLWFRDIINFMPFFFALAILFYYRYKEKLNFGKIFSKIAFYLLPVMISITLLGVHRYHNTGSFRPTQTFFWHAFFCAVSQFDNPYGIKNTDADVWAFGHKLNPEVRHENQFAYSESASNIYEETLKKEGMKFIKKNPAIFIRNMIYRTGIMIAPTFFTISESSFAHTFNNIFAQISGVFLVLLWALGLFHLFKIRSTLLFVIIPIYLYFFSIFSWYYLIGRVILCFVFLNIIFYMYGLTYVYNVFLKWVKLRKTN